jgi:hypothetical protein
MEQTISDSDGMSLLSLLPAMKQLSPLDNLDFRVELQEILRRKLRRLATREVELITYPGTSSASPVLFEYSDNSHISLADYTSASLSSSKKCHRNSICCSTDRIINVQQILLATKHAVVKNIGKLYYSVLVIVLCHYFRNKSTILIILH